MFGLGGGVQLQTARLTLRPPRMSDWRSWAATRRASRDFLQPWEPVWAADHLTKRAFRHRVHWSRKAIRNGRAPGNGKFGL